MAILTRSKKDKAPARKGPPARAAKPAEKAAAGACPKCGEPLVTDSGAEPRCRVCQPLSGTYKLGADGRLVRVSDKVPGLSHGGSSGEGEACGEGACGMPGPGAGGCGGGGCC